MDFQEVLVEYCLSSERTITSKVIAADNENLKDNPEGNIPYFFFQRG